MNGNIERLVYREICIFIDSDPSV